MATRIRMAALALVLSAGGTARAEEARPAALRERIDALERRLDELSATMATTIAPEVGTASESARRAEEQIAALTERIADLSEELREVQSGASDLEEHVEDQRARVDDLEGITEGLADREEERAASPMVEWTGDRGVIFRPPAGGLELLMRGFVLGRYEAVIDDSGADLAFESEFSVPEARLRFVTSMLDDRFLVAVEPSLSDGRARLQDGYVELSPHEAIHLRIGQMRVPFDREWELAEIAQPFTERSEIAREFAHGRDLGAMALGALAGGQLVYGLGLFNGSGAWVGNDNFDMLLALRLRYTVLGTHSGFWSDLPRSRSPRLSLGLGFSFDLADTEAADGSGRHYNRAEYQLTADGLFQWRGAHLAAAVHYRAADHGAASDVVHAYGYLIEAGYMAWREHLEIVARYTALDPDVQGYDDHGREVAAGVNVFLHGQHARMGLFYAYMFRLPGLEADELRRDGHALRLQLQGYF
jgi:hypothetical protein